MVIFLIARDFAKFDAQIPIIKTLHVLLGPVVNEPESVSSVASSHKKKSGKKKKVLPALIQALGVSGDDDSRGEDKPRSEIKARRPRKVLVKLKEGERVLDFWSSFCKQMLDWDIKLGSTLAIESAIAEKHEVRNTSA